MTDERPAKSGPRGAVSAKSTPLLRVVGMISLSGFTAGSPVSLSAGYPLGVYLSLSQAGDLLGVTTSTDGSKRVTKFRFDKSDLSTLDSEMTTYTHSFYVSAPLIDFTAAAASARRRAIVNINMRRR